jgi:MFS family permease
MNRDIPQMAAVAAAGTPGREWSTRSVYALTLLTLISAFNYFDRSILGLVLPLLQKDMHVSDTEIGLIAGAVFAVVNAVVGIPVGRLADRYSRRNIIGIGLIFWSAMTALTGMVSSVWQLAATRFLMGAGETASVAPSNSMLADIFTRAKRTLATSILVAGNPLGSVLFVPVAGWVAHAYGWRAVFVAAGIPGILLGVLFFLTVKEPVRGGLEPVTAAKPAAESLGTTVRFLMGSKSYIFLLLGAALMSTNVALSTWYAAFYDRVHHLPIAEIGIIIGPGRGIGGLIAVIAGGYAVDRLALRSDRWRFLFPALAAGMVVPTTILFLLSGSVAWSVTGLVLANLCSAATQGAVYAACVMLAKVRMRATAVAIFLLAVNVLGYASGPAIVGVLNDVLQPHFGAYAIRYALLTGALVAGLGSLCYLLAARFVIGDIRRTSQD